METTEETIKKLEAIDDLLTTFFMMNKISIHQGLSLTLSVIFRNLAELNCPIELFNKTFLKAIEEFPKMKDEIDTLKIMKKARIT